MRILRLTAASLSVVCCCVCSTFGQTKEIPVYELFDVSLEELLNVGIISATKKKQSAQDAPATAYVFTREQIQNRGYFNLLELLQDVPEIEFQKNSDPESRNQITVRGVAGNEKFLILLNGIRITPATGDGYVIGTNLSLANAQRVEVILGPASALYGVDAFTGIVNIITLNQEGNAYKGGEFTGSYGQYNTADNSFVGGVKVDKAYITITGHHHYSSEPDYHRLYKNDYIWYNTRTSTEGNIIESPYYNYMEPLTKYQDAAGFTFHGKPLSTGFAIPSQSYFVNAEINFSNFSVGFNRHMESHNTSTGVDSKYTTYDADAFMKNTVDVFYAKHTFTSFNKKWGIQSTFTQGYYELDPESHFASAASRWQRGFVYANGQSSKIEEQFNYEFSNKVSLIAGGSYERLSALPRTGLSTVPYDKSKPAVEQDLYYVGLGGFIRDANGDIDLDALLEQILYNLNYQNASAYLQFQAQAGKSLQFTIGSRYDYNTRFGGSINPRAGVVFSPNKKLRIKALYGESFLAPSPKKAYQQSGTFSGYFPLWAYQADYFRIANPNLESEKLRSAEISFNYFITPNLSISGDGYYTEVSNMIDFYARADKSLAPVDFEIVHLEQSANTGKSVVKGATGKINYLLKFGRVNINTYSAFSFTDGETTMYDWELEREVVNPLFFAARVNWKSGVDLTTPRLSVSSRINYRSSSLASFRDGEDVLQGTRGNFNSNRAFAVVDVFVKYKLLNTKEKQLSIFVKAANATDLRYHHVFTGNREGFRSTPQDPLRMSGGIHYKF